MSISTLSFTGISSFSDDFQLILDRSVSIASLPLTELLNSQTDILSKETLLSSFDAAVQDLADAITALGELGASSAISASTSNANRVTVTVTGDLTASSHTITEITSVARQASGTSVSGYASSTATAVSSDGTMELVVGDVTYTLDLTGEGDNSLNGLASAINGLGAGVTATILNTGDPETPYYLSLTTTGTGLQALELRETAGVASTNILTNTVPETDAVFASNAGYATTDATEVSPDGILQLAVGTSTYVLDISSDNTLEGLRDAINNAGAGLTAAIVASEDGKYRLRITSPNGEAVELRETAGDSTSNVLTNALQGADAVFKLDGIQITKPENTITDVIDGLAFTIKSTTDAGESVAITLASSRGDVSSALSDLTTAYNAVKDLVNAQIGETAGMLTGDAIVREIQSSLRALTTYHGTGTIQSLADLGIELDSSGVMSYDSTVLYGLSSSQFADVFGFLGSATSGLGAVANRFTAISDDDTGLIALQQENYEEADERLQEQIDKLTQRINLMQTNLSAQLAAADTLLASLESDQLILDASLEALNYALFGKQES